MGELWENYGRTVVAVNYRSRSDGSILPRGCRGRVAGKGRLVRMFF
jgi:hypothetical protein